MIPHPLPLEVYSIHYICLAEFSAPVPSPNQLHDIITLMCVCVHTQPYLQFSLIKDLQHSKRKHIIKPLHKLEYNAHSSEYYIETVTQKVQGILSHPDLTHKEVLLHTHTMLI